MFGPYEEMTVYRPGTTVPDKAAPFVPVEVTKEAKGYYKWINDHIWDLKRMQRSPEELAAEPGPQCTEPYECWY